MKKKREDFEKKQEEVQKHFDKTKELEEIKSYEFNKKMDDLEKQKKILEKIREEEINNRKNEFVMKSMKNLHLRNLKEKRDEKKIDSTVIRINEFFYKNRNKKQFIEQELMFKNETNSLKRVEKQMKIRRIENIKEYEINKEREKLEENYKKFEDFHNQKSFFSKHKRYLSLEISKQRKSIVDKFNEYIDRNKEITVNLFLKFKNFLFF